VIGEGRNQLRVIVGSDATGAGLVGAALGAVQSVTSRFELVLPPRPSAFARAVTQVPERTHRVVFADLRDVG
jgi:hypothetical protein